MLKTTLLRLEAALLDSTECGYLCTASPDSCRCPFTGRTMIQPVIAEDGINYEKTNIEGWIRIQGVSPVSGSAIQKLIIPNRGLQNFIEESNFSPDSEPINPALITRIRLRATLHWLTKSKIDIEDGLPQGVSLDRFHNTWPLTQDAAACVEIAWNTLPRLRQLVYAQFAMMTDSDIQQTRNVSKAYFTQSMKDHLYEGKIEQIISALEAFAGNNRELLKRLNKYRQSEDSELFNGWCRYWNEPIPTLSRPMLPLIQRTQEYRRYGGYEWPFTRR